MRGDRVKQLRKEMKWTQEELGKRVDLKKSTISEIENNKKDAGRKAITKIATVLNCTTDFLLGLSDDPQLSSEQYSDLRKKFDVLLEKLEQKPKHEQEMLYKMMQAALGSDE
ncbi:transcriptional regulator [Bacillus pseudomycoides]|uniref:helix-turn-helix domain-containing protein n=1 Tax=Bacillus pseudomycoides TaxID=64104 RepID=UPI001785AF59|nr:helix-turn-helix transcriptional regulator [Bacillus pseudomycoides]MBD5797285.1 transcriptional regulator [Bacillus pseudomycoides]